MKAVEIERFRKLDYVSFNLYCFLVSRAGYDNAVDFTEKELTQQIANCQHAPAFHKESLLLRSTLERLVEVGAVEVVEVLGDTGQSLIQKDNSVFNITARL